MERKWTVDSGQWSATIHHSSFIIHHFPRMSITYLEAIREAQARALVRGADRHRHGAARRIRHRLPDVVSELPHQQSLRHHEPAAKPFGRIAQLDLAAELVGDAALDQPRSKSLMARRLHGRPALLGEMLRHIER